MADEVHVQVRFTVHDDESGTDFTDALYYPIGEWPVDAARMDADKQSRYDEWKTATAQPAAEVDDDGEPVEAPQPTAQDRLDEARGLLARLDELRLQAQVAVDQLSEQTAAVADEGA